jgi:hypothetical protein
VRLGATSFNRDFKNPSKWQWTARAPLLNHAIAVLEQWKTELAVHHPDIVPTLEAEQALLRDCLANKSQEERKAAGLPEQRSFGGGYSGCAPQVYSKAPDLMRYTLKKLDLTTGQFFNNWGAWLSITAATPVSDGEVVCVMFGPGQMATYELATGRRLWAWRDPLGCGGTTTHLASPMLWKDLMIFMSPARDTARPPTYAKTMKALDKRTGAVRWEVPVPGSSRSRDQMSPLLFTMGDRAVVVSNTGLTLLTGKQERKQHESKNNDSGTCRRVARRNLQRGNRLQRHSEFRYGD